jgi:hypothetical protein
VSDVNSHMAIKLWKATLQKRVLLTMQSNSGKDFAIDDLAEGVEDRKRPRSCLNVGNKLKCAVGEHEAGRQLRYFRREREF